VQDRVALNPLKLGPQLLGNLPPERFFGLLARQDMTAWEVPHVRIPPPPRRPVAQQHLVCPDQDHGNDVVIFHRSSLTGRGAAASSSVFERRRAPWFWEITAYHTP
jgi:hypothetical protein